ncbi:MAG: transglycosylase domain-containing protein [Ideonella sp.]|nr:transglycosylase domain-containing protein [Ideonella sp.]
MRSSLRHLVRLAALLLVALACLQAVFVGRIALMRWVDPQSTAFQRSEIWRLWRERGQVAWSQRWVPGERIDDDLKRAVIASEDAGFVEHSGFEWEAIERAWERNQRNWERNQRAQAMPLRRAPAPGARRARPLKLVGGSTITQQLAKNLFLSGERTLARKAQEFVIASALEALLDKRRILEIYLNSVEWGEGIFGAGAAARHYYRTDADRLGAHAAARLAVMLPAPKRFERNPGSAYVSARAATIVARMGDVELP